jgi:hypothetical protein
VPPHDRASASATPAAAGRVPPPGADAAPDQADQPHRPDRAHEADRAHEPDRAHEAGRPDGRHGRHDHHDLVDWHRTGRRLRRQAVIILTLVVVAWLVLGLRAGAPTARTLAELLGLGVLVAIAGEIVVVGGAALKGLLVAGDRGDRLAGTDVSLLPPQVSRRLRQRRR